MMAKSAPEKTTGDNGVWCKAGWVEVLSLQVRKILFSLTENVTLAAQAAQATQATQAALHKLHKLQATQATTSYLVPGYQFPTQHTLTSHLAHTIHTYILFEGTYYNMYVHMFECVLHSQKCRS